MAVKINEVSAYVFGRVKPVSPREAYGHSDPAGRGYYTMAEMGDDGGRTEEFMRSQKSSNNMANVEGEMIGSWNLDF